MKPMMLGYVAFRDGDETGKSRFRGQQIVERFVQSSGTIRISETVPNREDAPSPVVEEIEPHAGGNCRCPSRESRELAHGQGWDRFPPRHRLNNRTGPESDLVKGTAHGVMVGRRGERFGKFAAYVRE